MKFKILFILFGSLLFLQGNCQSKIAGFIKDIETGETLIGAHIYDTINQKGAVTNNFGYFSIDKLVKGAVLKVSYIGYSPMYFASKSFDDTLVTILLEKHLLLGEVLISGGRDNIRTDLAGIETITSKMVNSLPSIMGEPDLIKTLTLMPGVSFGNEAVSGFFVRGSSSDQNLVLIDGVPIYNPYHLHGYFSVFNSEAINHSVLYKGFVPAGYGGRLASVLDINMREGNSRHLEVKLSLGTVSSKFMVEGPIVPDQTSFLVSIRRSMLDIFNPVISKNLAFFSGMSAVAKDMDVTDYYFYDFNTKVNHTLNKRNRIFVNYYRSRDNYQNENGEVALKNSIVWENKLASLRWNHIYSNNLFSNFTLYHTNYKYNSKEALYIEDSNLEIENSINYLTAIRDYGLKLDFSMNVNNHMLTFGINYINQVVNPGVTSINQLGPDSGQSIDTTISSKRLTHQINTYVADEFIIFKKVKFNTGVHISSYQTDGTNYVSFQPRILIDYNPLHNLSLKSSYTSMVQHLHLLSNTWSGNPSDMWVPSTSMVKPETANQFSAGLTYQLDKWYFITEAYLKAMNHLIDYKEGSSYSSSNKGWESMIEEGTGKAHGIECSVKKEQGIFSGLISYSYSKSIRKFETINRGNEFPYTYDRTHQVTTALIYQLNKVLSFGANWVFATGQPVTIAESYVVDNLNLNRAGYYKYYRSLNHVRLPNYHRLDFSINYIKNHPKFNYKWSLGVYNAYNRKNPYSIYEADESLYINSLLGFTPYLTITLGFNTKKNV